MELSIYGGHHENHESCITYKAFYEIKNQNMKIYLKILRYPECSIKNQVENILYLN